ncbi:hypothetical protein RP75_28905 [Agrobacterium arsenijevicii]|uniref:Uncharacterized protein n=1 Tax=Agrobacterium arsenijevicii TaxID=1585697 RepID=A0ABR5CYT3_9HYPH|nr:hypothetical protein RP75_28905 [Agrobacterium arsenijevicii]
MDCIGLIPVEWQATVTITQPGKAGWNMETVSDARFRSPWSGPQTSAQAIVGLGWMAFGHKPLQPRSKNVKAGHHV